MSDSLPINPTPEAYVGEYSHRVDLSTGAQLSVPDEGLINWLQHQDTRVRYFPTDIDLAESDPGYEFFRGIADPVGQRIYEDFIGQNVAIRSSTAALETPYPFWPDDNGGMVPMNTVLDILKTGSDTGSDQTRVGYLDSPNIEQPAKLNYVTHEWLKGHIGSIELELSHGDVEDHKNLDQTFPVVIVYDEDAFSDDPQHGWRTLTGDPSHRIKAIYITDKISVMPRRESESPASTRDLSRLGSGVIASMQERE